MIWIDVRQLEQKILNNDLSDKEGVSYLLANMIMFSLIPYLSAEHYQNTWLTITEAFIDVVITVLLVKATFDIHGSGDTKGYFKIFLALSFVNAMRLILYAVIVSIPLALVMVLIVKSAPIDKTIEEILQLMANLTAGVIYYFMLTNSFKRLNEKKPQIYAASSPQNSVNDSNQLTP